MGSQNRQYSRIKCESHCVLMDQTGSIFDASIEDISLGGALISVKNGIPISLHDGEECSLTLCHDTSLRHSCRIIRHDSENIGISFISAKLQ